MGYRWLVARQALLGIGLVLLAAGCGGDAPAGCALGGSSPAAPAASLAFRCDLDAQGHPASADIFQLRTDGSQAVRLTAGLGWATDPAWSPAGKGLALTTTRAGSANLYLVASAGAPGPAGGAPRAGEPLRNQRGRQRSPPAQPSVRVQRRAGLVAGWLPDR